MKPLHPAQAVDVLATAQAVSVTHSLDSNHADYGKTPCVVSELVAPGDAVDAIDNTPAVLAPEA
jgi:hypothetical protein